MSACDSDVSTAERNTSDKTHCPNCKKAFKITDISGLQFPLILPACNHCCCRGCVIEAYTGENSSLVVCGKCGKQNPPMFPIGRAMSNNIQEGYPPVPHFFLSNFRQGEKSKPLDESLISFSNNVTQTQKTMSLSPSRTICAECDEINAIVRCIECQTNLCGNCNKECHDKKTTKTHRRTQIFNDSDNMSLPQMVPLRFFQSSSNLERCCEIERVYEEGRELPLKPDVDFVSYGIMNPLMSLAARPPAKNRKIPLS